MSNENITNADEILTQRNYWNSEVNAFHSIYSHQKSKLARYLDQVFRKDMYDRFVFTIDNCAPVERRSFLDVGCGSGIYSLELARRGAASVTGLDIAENMLEICRRSAAQERVDDRCRFLHTDLLEYRADSSFDVSIGIGLFDYISDPLPVLKKMRQVTTDKAIMSFPRLYTWRAPVRKARLSLKGCPVFFYTREKIGRLLKEAGFESHEVTKVGKLHCVIAHSGGRA
ncbi:MAG TPA: class I SAM-dependent methyltransferase [Blastocatellia bacterium]|nr:class I SAM-dependent methyltransferase [Blastocatellia bacterium]